MRHKKNDMWNLGQGQRVIIYGRFSPRPRPEDCDSCERQIQDCVEYCSPRKWEVMGTFWDKGVSGKHGVADRPGLFDAIASLKRGYVLLVRNIDRLGRANAIDTLMIEKSIKNKGARVISINGEGTTTEGPEGMLIKRIFSAMAEFQREMSRARTRAAMLRHQRNGRRMGSQTPYGQMDNPKNKAYMVPDEKEQENIAYMQRLRASGLSLGKIVKQMEEEGRRCRGKYWYKTTVKRVLEREEENGEKKEAGLS